MRKVEVTLGALHYQIYQRLCISKDALKVERAQLGDEKFEVLAHWSIEDRVRSTRRQLLDRLRFARVKLYQAWDGIFVLKTTWLRPDTSLRNPLGEPADEVRLR